MFDQIYKTLRKDFQFLSKYGFNFSYIEHHYVMPSVVLSDGIRRIQVGMNYEDMKIFVILYKNQEQVQGVNLLENVAILGTSYNKQLQEVINYLNNYFCNNYSN